MTRLKFLTEQIVRDNYELISKTVSAFACRLRVSKSDKNAKLSSLDIVINFNGLPWCVN